MINSHEGEIAEQRYAYTRLQGKIDNYNKEMHRLKVKIGAPGQRAMFPCSNSQPSTAAARARSIA